MPKPHDVDAAILARFERGLRNALNTPPDEPRKKAKPAKKAKK